jgi:hypothetical protein
MMSINYIPRGYPYVRYFKRVIYYNNKTVILLYSKQFFLFLSIAKSWEEKLFLNTNN